MTVSPTATGSGLLAACVPGACKFCQWQWRWRRRGGGSGGGRSGSSGGVFSCSPRLMQVHSTPGCCFWPATARCARGKSWLASSRSLEPGCRSSRTSTTLSASCPSTSWKSGRAQVRRCLCRVFPLHSRRRHLCRACVSTAFTAKTPPLPCVSTALTAKTPPFSAEAFGLSADGSPPPIGGLFRNHIMASHGLQLRPLWIIPAAAVSRHVSVHLQAAAFERLCAEAEAAAAVGAAAAGSEEHLAVDETAILLHPPLPLAGVSIVMKRERQQNDSLANG